jgi:uncharacterized protein YkwD
MKIMLLLPLLILFGNWETTFSDHRGSYSYRSPSEVVRPPTSQPATSSTNATSSTKVATRTKQTAPKPTVVPAAANLAPVPAPQPVASSPTPPAPATESFATQIETRIFAQMNVEREREGLSALSSDSRLAAIARSHSDDMLTNNYFSHNDPNGCGSSCRADAAGYAWRAIGENIYMMSGYSLSADEAAAKVVTGWMNSSGHRANILGSQYTHVGVGVVQKGKSVYVTAVYAKPR